LEDEEVLRQAVMEREGRESELLDDLTLLRCVIANIQENLCRDYGKPSIADLARLMELRRELAYLEQGPMTAQWIDKCQQISANDE
jgi:hypothetical protein